jgi:hypothetical protein
MVNSTTSKITNQFIAAEYPITVGWASSDFDKFTPASAPLLKAVDTTTSNHNKSMQIPASTPSGLSAEAKGWIAVGTICGVLFFIVLGILLTRARRHHIEKNRSSEITAAVNREIVSGKAESDSSAIFEADAESRTAEADPSNVRVELEGDWHGYEASERTSQSFQMTSGTD